jgi:hypothetical protein
MMYVMHEYGHYGHKKTNKGNRSGEGIKTADDQLESSDSKPPIQRKTSPANERGGDIDNWILYGSYRQKNPQISRKITTGVMDEVTKMQIKNSNRYKKWLSKRQ